MDQGLFDEAAVIRRVSAEAVLIAGGGAAILLQVAHPGVAAGVAQYSDFAHRPLDRLRATLSYVFGVVYGSRREAELVSGAVRALHRKVRGTDETGRPYSAGDPDLMVWVNATLFHTARRINESVFGPLPDEEADELYRDHAVLATSLGCPADAWPATRADFATYWDRAVAGLEVTEGARTIARDLLYNRAMPFWLRPANPINRFVTIALLPPEIRGGYGFAWTRGRERALRLARFAVRHTYRFVPAPIRHLPKTLYLAALRRRLRRAPREVRQL